MAKQVTTLTAARKMAKKGGQASLQVDITTDEEWDGLIERNGLVVCDIYTDWCGPCVGMMSNLKKVKLEIGSDLLHLAMANSDKIAKLERFRGRSEPTWMFIGTGHLLKILYGSNAPLLMKEIYSEFDKELKAIQGLVERVTYPFDQLTPFEKVKLEELEAKKAAELAKERAMLEARQNKMKRHYLEKLARKLYNFSLVVFFPNAIQPPDDENPRKTSPAAYKLMSLYDTVGLSICDQLEVQLKMDEINEMFYNSGYNLPQKIYNLMLAEEIIVSLVQMSPSLKVPPPVEQLNATGSHMSLVSQTSLVLDIVEENLSRLVYGIEKNPQRATPDTVYKMFETVDSDGEVLPPCWTPKEHISKCSAARIAFPTRISQLNVKEMEVPPPAYIMIFEGERAKEILDISKPFASEIVHLGYFDSMNPSLAKRLCKTVYELEELPDEDIDKSKMVIALSKDHSDPTLILTQLGPLYVSPDLETADQEIDLFFPPTMDDDEDIVNPWGPPPVIPTITWTDENGNEFQEVYIKDNKGVTRRVRKMIKWADGTEILEGGRIVDMPEEDIERNEEIERLEYEEIREIRRQERLERKRIALAQYEEEQAARQAELEHMTDERPGSIAGSVNEDEMSRMSMEVEKKESVI